MTNNDLIDEAFSEMENLKTVVEQLQRDMAELKQILQLKPTVAGSQRGQKPSSSKSLPEGWQYPTITEEIATAVISSNGLKAAAEKLDTNPKDLTNLLNESGVPHLYGEKWAIALKRAVAGKEPIDTFIYPEKWIEKKDKIKKYYNDNGMAKTRQLLTNSEMSPSLSQVGRFLQLYC